MKELFFHVDDNDGDVGAFIRFLGDHQIEVLEDLLVIADHGPESLNCEKIETGIWEYQRSLGQGRRVVLLFDFIEQCDVYIVLHGFRSGAEGIKRPDLQLARRRRRRYPR